MTPRLIEEMWAWVSVDPADNTEGVIAHFDTELGIWIPLVGADADRVRSQRSLAELTGRMTGLDVRLVRFSTRTLIVTVRPDGSVKEWPDVVG